MLCNTYMHLQNQYKIPGQIEIKRRVSTAVSPATTTQVAASKVLPTTAGGKTAHHTHTAGGKTAHHTHSRWENSLPHTQQVGKQPTTHTQQVGKQPTTHTQQVGKQPTTHTAGGKTAYHTHSPPHIQQVGKQPTTHAAGGTGQYCFCQCSHPPAQHNKNFLTNEVHTKNTNAQQHQN